MVVLFRGLHCPSCQSQLRELDRRLEEITELCIQLIADSGETQRRTDETSRGCF